ncbi:MAG: endolytic transglycosylase MltG [Candidatus Colwellbacteria bacterium CG10_big_fil_rev_8_21_14_0_10_41_28]|uniref:Endolytic transglycosylase MltG n=1 Tax=Candidatus Colwellbacteria bacterium CG10_big_fil_rev_8_21_14_0_10_41_28 TaxID=1974539 RepID=A0A2H0VGW9_9BACT|nr:MAG: endolytic transglycosylase MltG [Candidatus Colwellbacteria bacterium CG10_big_fil_rev_8_21_14_0_10_41_28]
MKKPTPLVVISILFLGFVVWSSVRTSEIPEAPKATITIPEGWNIYQVNQHLKDQQVLVDGEIPLSEEGYIFPDTYEFFLDSSLDVVTGKFKSNFEDRLAQINLSNQTRDLDDILTMASILEKEVQTLREKRIASGVLWKRISAGMPLQVDATICYIKRDQPCLPITRSDKEIDSPYNTYLYRGLPPGPISNPGSDSIVAAANPIETSYWYYISDHEKDVTVFSKTLDEHNANIVKYLND